MKKILKFSPTLLIFVPFVRTYFNSLFIFKDGEISFFLFFFVCYLLVFLIFYKLLNIIFKTVDPYVLMYIVSWVGFVFFQYKVGLNIFTIHSKVSFLKLTILHF